MKNKKPFMMGITIIAILVLLFGFIILKNITRKERQKEKDLKIVTSFYPVYIMTKNITEGASNVKVVNMTEKTAGCIHDYTLTTSDLKKIEDADIFIENGLGLESFTDKILATYPNIKVIETAQEIEELMETVDDNYDKVEEYHNEDIEETSNNHNHEIAEESEEHHHHGVNGHIWMSIEKYKMQIKKIAEELSKKNPENRDIFMANLEKYTNELNKLQQEYETVDEKVKGKYVVSLNEAFEYINEDLDINMITIETNHEKEAFSAESLKQIIEDVKQYDIKVIIVDKEDNLKNAEAIAEETGAKVFVLDSCLKGEDNTMSYINAMRNNLEILKNI